MSDEREVGTSRYLADLVHRIGCARFPDPDRAVVRHHMLDAFAAALIGCRGHAFADLAKLCPTVSKGCVWPGSGQQKAAPIDGAMLWSFAVHASVFEDGSREGACHPAAVIFPSIAAFSEGKNWQDVERAAIAGYEVMVRIARGGNPAFARRGFHPTAIAAPFGAAAAVSLLLGYDAATVQNALCLAAMGGAGLMASFKAGATQPLQVAWAVRSGVMSALMAGAGHTGYETVIDEGFYPAHLGNGSPIPIDRALKYEYAIRGSYLKPYPGCRHVHPSIDALAKVLERMPISPRQVKSIVVRTYGVAVEAEIDTLKSRGDAYFNTPYALAARMVLGRCDWDAFDERHFSNESILESMNKISVRVDPEIDSLYPDRRGSFVEVHTADGNLHCEKVDYALGEPELPLPEAMVREKFRRCAAGVLSPDSIGWMEAILDVSHTTESPESLFRATSAAVQARRGAA